MVSSLKGGSLPYYKVIFACTLCIVLTYMYSKKISASHKEQRSDLTSVCEERMNVVRLKNHRLSQPLLLSDIASESSSYSNLKQDLLNKISIEKATGKIGNVSVYLRAFNNGSWMGIQQNELYDPGSIMKLPILLAYLKKQEISPGFFDKRIKFEAYNPAMPKQTIVTQSIEIGKSYSVRDLLHSMIIDSDNQANMLLNQNIEPEYVFNVFSDLGMNVPNIRQSEVKMSAIDLSKFMRVLYNSSYINQSLSEFGLQMLTDTKFSDGIKKGVADTILIAHKFGERGYRDTTYQEIHETAIIYIDNNPVLLTIMTSGYDQTYQTQLIASIAKSCFDWLMMESSSN